MHESTPSPSPATCPAPQVAPALSALPALLISIFMPGLECGHCASSFVSVLTFIYVVTQRLPSRACLIWAVQLKLNV